MKIYVVTINNNETGRVWAEGKLIDNKDGKWIYQEVFYTLEEAQEVFWNASPINSMYTISLHEFEV